MKNEINKKNQDLSSATVSTSASSSNSSGDTQQVWGDSEHLQQDLLVYREMDDQTSVRMNLLQQVQSQFDQLQVMSERRTFLLNEILSCVENKD